MQTVILEEGGLVPEREKVVDIIYVGRVAGSLEPVVHGQYAAEVEIPAPQHGERTRDINGQTAVLQ